MRAASLLLVGLAIAALMAGCSSAPSPVEPDIGTELPEHFGSDPTTSTATESGTPWWESFEDPRLNELIAEALERNNDLRAAAARVEAAQAQARIVGADLKPQVSADLNGGRRRQNFIGLPIPGSEGNVLSTTTTSWSTNLNVSWEVDLWGRLRAARAGALTTYAATELDYTAGRLSLAGQTAKAWFAVLESDGQVGVAQRTLDTRRLTLDRIRRRYASGLATPLELRFAVSDHALAESLHAQREQQAEAARRVLQLLIRQYPSGKLEGLAAEAALPQLPGPVPAGLPADLVTQRPDLAAAEARLLSAGYSVTEARRSLYPRLALTGSAGAASEDIEDLLDSDFSVWSLAGGLLAPIFQGGRLRAAVDFAEARQEETLALYVQAILDAFEEVEGSLAAERFLSRRENSLSVAVREAEKALELAQDQYAAGLVTYLAVLESQRQVLNSESQFLAVLRQRLDARVDFYLALGGDWERDASPAADFPIASNISQENSER